VIDALISGRLYGAPVEREARNGNRFVTAKVRAAARNGEALFVNVVAFLESAVTALLALGDGDAVALAGELSAKAYTDKQGEPRPSLDLVAHAVLSEYQVQHKRQALRERAEVPGKLPFNDDLSGVG
jgi:single-stranded DNA-binding protein